ncbi:MAG: hypothetical protein U1G05_15785 [Kiritimatiellia bacterium]
MNSAFPSALRTTTSVWSPRKNTADSGTSSAWSRMRNTRLRPANMPGFRSPSALSRRACTRTVRLAASTTGAM